MKLTRFGEIKDGRWTRGPNTTPRVVERRVNRLYRNEMKRQAKRITVALRWQRFLTNPSQRATIVLRNGRQVVLDRGTTEGIFIERSFADKPKHYSGRRAASLAKRQTLEAAG